MFPLFLQLPEKRILDPNGPYISTFQKILRNVCLSVILEFCLSSVICRLPSVVCCLWSVVYDLLSVICSTSAAYTSLCRDLKYWLKVRYIILTWPNFLFSRLFLWAGRKHWSMFENNIKKCTAFVFGKTKLSQIVCLINAQK